MSFGWGDGEETSPDELASLMESKFPEMIQESRGNDPEYVSWLKSIIEESEPDGLFIEFWDSYDGPCDYVALINCSSKRKFEHAPD